MIKLYEKGIYLSDNNEIVAEDSLPRHICKEDAKKGTIAWSILSAHNTSGDMNKLKIKFDSLASHDITFVGIIQTAKASGMERFPLPYVTIIYFVCLRHSVTAESLCRHILLLSINTCVK